MNQPLITCSAPGSLMLLGEHAVLHGRRALVCAIDQHMTVSLTSLDLPVLRIDSELGQYESPLDQLEDHPDFRFVLDAVKQYPLEKGIELNIKSDFSSDIGFGSSAAVTVATHAVLGRANSPGEPLHKYAGSPGRFAPPSDSELLGRAMPSSFAKASADRPGEQFKMELFKRSLATVHRVQGRGSGSDVAASVFGGVVAYRAEPFENPQGKPLEIHPMAESFPLTAVYSGSKMKTVDVIRHLEERRALNPDYFEKIFDRMDASVGEAVQLFGGASSPMPADGGDAVPPAAFGRILIENQKLMEEMGLCNAALAEIISIFQTLEVPAKISGSGLGDCAIGLGGFPAFAKASENTPTFGTYKTYALRVEPQGVVIA